MFKGFQLKNKSVLILGHKWNMNVSVLSNQPPDSEFHCSVYYCIIAVLGMQDMYLGWMQKDWLFLTRSE